MILCFSHCGLPDDQCACYRQMNVFNGPLPDGPSRIENVLFGFMVGVRELPNGQLTVECPADAPEIRGPAEAAYVRRALASWSQSLGKYDAALSSDEN